MSRLDSWINENEAVFIDRWNEDGSAITGIDTDDIRDMFTKNGLPEDFNINRIRAEAVRECIPELEELEYFQAAEVLREHANKLEGDRQ